MSEARERDVGKGKDEMVSGETVCAWDVVLEGGVEWQGWR